MAWTAYIDGGSRGNPGPAAAGVHILDDAGKVVFSGGKFLGSLTNNAAEYNGLITALTLLAKAGARRIHIISDSELMVHQINGVYKVRSPDLRPLHAEARKRLSEFEQWDIRHVYRDANAAADELANRAMDACGSVVVVDQLHLAGKNPAKTRSREKKTKPAGDSTTVVVRVVHPPGEGICPAGLRRGESFAFAATTPAGVCTVACARIAAAVALVQAGERPPAAGVTCPREGCGARFEIELERC